MKCFRVHQYIGAHFTRHRDRTVYLCRERGVEVNGRPFNLRLQFLDMTTFITCYEACSGPVTIKHGVYEHIKVFYCANIYDPKFQTTHTPYPSTACSAYAASRRPLMKERAWEP